MSTNEMPTSTWKRADVAAVERPGRAAVLPLGTRLDRAPFVLEAQAATIWQALTQEPRTETAIVSEVAATYGVSVELIREDVVGFLSELQRNELAIEETPS